MRNANPNALTTSPKRPTTEVRFAGASRAARLLNGALEHVESKSIREWVVSEHNAPLWLQIAENAVSKGKDPQNPDHVLRFATYIVCTAIGL